MTEEQRKGETVNWPNINFTDPAPPKAGTKAKKLWDYDPDYEEEEEEEEEMEKVLEPVPSSTTSAANFYGKPRRKGVAKLDITGMEDELETAEEKARRMRHSQRDGRREERKVRGGVVRSVVLVMALCCVLHSLGT